MIGKMLGNRYEIIEKVGGGGMALVYKAKCNLLNRFVAVKVLRSEFTTDKDLIEKFKKESQAAASLSHPNIVNIYDVGADEDVYYIVMEYVEGATLKQVIKESDRLSIGQIIDFSKQIASALQHAHNNHIVHRDIKPHNILITSDHRAKVTDFGIALAATSSTLTNAGSVIGSVHYFSPEQARGGYTDEKSDLYSLGIVMYEMATGRVPFEGDTPITVALKHIQEKPTPPSVLNPSIPKRLEEIILKLMQKEQSLRYQSTKALIEDLSKLESDPNPRGQESMISEEDSPTQILPIIKDEDLNKEQDSPYMPKKASTQKKKSNKKLVISAVVAAFIAALLFTFGFFYLGNIFRIEEVEVPNLIGMNRETAEQEVANRGLQLSVESKYDREAPADQIISQSPTQGMKVKKGYPVKVVISLGSRPVEVPDLVFKNAADATFLLEDAGLKDGKVDYDFSDLPIGTIIRQNPRAGFQAPEGSTVDYVVSKGPEVVTFPMPSVIGTNLNTARRTLEQLGLRLGNIDEEYSNEYVRGVVIRQSIEPGAEVQENALIDLVISKGSDVPEQREDLELDDEIGDGEEDTTVNTSSGNLSSKKTIDINLREYSGVVDVRIVRLKGSVRQEVYSKKHDIDREGAILRVSISGSGEETFEIYVNGQRENQTIKIQF